MATTAGTSAPLVRTELRGWINLLFLCLIGVLSSVDFQLIYLLLQPVKMELQLSDAQLGIITGSAVAIIMAAAAFPIGWAADRFGRRLALFCSIFFWSAMTALCGLATSFESFLFASAGLALGEAGIYGIIYAMIPDIVPARHRNAANTIILGVLVISAALGLIAGGAFLAWVDQLDLGGWAAWRVVFISVGLLGLPFAFLAAAIKPLGSGPRPLVRTAETEGERFGPYFRRYWLTVGIIFFAVNLYGAAWALWTVWSPALYSRTFGVAAAASGQMIGLANLAGCILALVAANLLYRWTHARLQERFAIRMLTLGCAFALLPLLLIWSAATPLQFIIGYALETASLVLAVSIAPMLLQDIAPPGLRSRVTGLVAPLGLPIKMIAPVVVGALSDASGENGLLLAICVVSAICLILSVAGFVLFEARYGRLVLSLYPRDDAVRK